MFEKLDEEIARVSAELNKLRQQKLEELKRQMRALESGAEAATSAEPRRSYRRISDAEVKDLLVKAVEEAGEAGISARKAAEEAGIPYPKARLFMPGLFKKTGAGKHTLYFTKRKKKA